MSGRTLLVLQVGERRVHVTVNVQSAHQHEINKWHAVRKNVYGNICLTQVSLEMCFSIGSSQQFCKKKGKNLLCQMTKDPTRPQPSEKGMASICDQTSSVQQH